METDGDDEFQLTDLFGWVWFSFLITLHSVDPENAAQSTVTFSYSKNCSLSGRTRGRAACETETHSRELGHEDTSISSWWSRELCL